MASSAVQVKWTDEQRRGIETAGRSLLVSAAAGSGKTAVLAARCAYLVCDAPPEHRCDVDELLVVTFTKAAAAEMRDRIERAIRARLEQSNDDARLARQLVLLDRASISTLHSFCTSVLRKHFNLVGLDPGFRTLDEEEAFLLRVETARELLEQRYESDASGAFHEFIDAYADGDDERVLWRIVHAHNLLCSVRDPEDWLAWARQRIASAAGDGPLHACELGKEMADLVTQRLADFQSRCVEAVRQFSASGDFVPYAEYVTELIAIVQELRSTFGGRHFDALAEAMNALQLPDLPRMSNSIPGKDEAKKLVDKLRDELRKGALFELCRFSGSEWRDGMKYILPAADVLIGLVQEFGQRYDAAKSEAGALDFNDLERLTLGVLRGPSKDGSLRPSGTARTYHRQFKHVLVDEYQDINEVQDAILSLVSRECCCGEDGAVQNLFCVGDVKQSIYRFRLADPTRFLERAGRFRTCNDLTVGEAIDLQSNFRSRSPLLDALNCVFERLMTEPAAEIEYDATHRLRPGATYPAPGGQRCFTGAPVEMHLVPAPDDAAPDESDAEMELDRTEREAALVASRIRELVECDVKQRFHVLDKDDDGSPLLRPVSYKDVVILLRAKQHKANQFADMLRANRIPVHSDSGGGFFGSTEIRDMLALLATLDNLQQDVPLAAVLRSPLSGLAEADDCLARIRLAYPDVDRVPFHRAVARYADEKDDELAAHLKDFLARLKEWRELAHQRPLAEVLWTIYDATGYLAFCAGLDDGEQRVANLTRLHERARQFGSFQRQGLRRFIVFLQSLQDDERDLALPSVASEADDVVRVMSIHRSKGLEFPVVVVPDLDKKHNMQDLSGPILIDRAAGLGLLCVDETKRIRYPSMASVLVAERIRRQMLAEELRVLYVAMTRAREHLILVGTCKPQQQEKWTARWASHDGALPADEVLRGGCMLDWLGPVAAATSHLSPRPIEVTVHTEEEVRGWSAPATHRPKLSAAQERLARLEALEPAPPAHPDAELIRRRLTGAYRYKDFTNLPASRTVGSLTKTGRRAAGGEHASRGAVVAFEEGLPAPRCVLESLSASPMEVGSTTHLVLQHLDFSRPCTVEDVKQQIHAMVARKLVAAGEADVVDADAIEWLVSTELGGLLRRHAKVLRRELPVFFPLTEHTSDAPPARVMTRGRIDAMVSEPDGLVLVDYKTDRVTRDTIEARAEFYRPQVESYGRAIGSIVGQRVKAVHLVFLAAREVRTMSQTP